MSEQDDRRVLVPGAERVVLERSVSAVRLTWRALRLPRAARHGFGIAGALAMASGFVLPAVTVGLLDPTWSSMVPAVIFGVMAACGAAGGGLFVAGWLKRDRTLEMNTSGVTLDGERLDLPEGTPRIETTVRDGGEWVPMALESVRTEAEAPATPTIPGLKTGPASQKPGVRKYGVQLRSRDRTLDVATDLTARQALVLAEALESHWQTPAALPEPVDDHDVQALQRLREGVKA